MDAITSWQAYFVDLQNTFYILGEEKIGKKIITTVCADQNIKFRQIFLKAISVHQHEWHWNVNKKLPSRVPQGFFGPYYFPVYINALPARGWVDYKITFFADYNFFIQANKRKQFFVHADGRSQNEHFVFNN